MWVSIRKFIVHIPPLYAMVAGKGGLGFNVYSAQFSSCYFPINVYLMPLYIGSI
jgi:hypothetical protein